MNEFMKNRKLLLFALISSIALMSCATGKQYTVDESIQNEKASATMTLEMKEIAIGIGGIKGNGILTYRDEQYPYKLKGIDYGSISKVSIKASGSVYHLDKLEDFEGIYFQAKAAFTIGSSGKAGMFLVNRRGVTIHLSSDEEKGFDLTLGRGGIKIKLKK